jgi:hypothetical protein
LADARDELRDLTALVAGAVRDTQGIAYSAEFKNAGSNDVGELYIPADPRAEPARIWRKIDRKPSALPQLPPSEHAKGGDNAAVHYSETRRERRFRIGIKIATPQRGHARALASN